MDFKKQAAAKAFTLIKDHTVVGVGAGSTIIHLADFLKEGIEEGLHVKLLTSSVETKQYLLHHGIPVGEMKAFSDIDIYFDGCDQFDKDLNALKSGGGIHTHEKLLASMAREFILVGDESKFAEKLDTKFPVVIELLPEADGFISSKINKFFPGSRSAARINNKGGIVLTANNNHLIDIWFSSWPELSTINPLLKSVTGVVETSLFYNMADKAIIAGENGTRIIEKTH